MVIYDFPFVAPSRIQCSWRKGKANCIQCIHLERLLPLFEGLTFMLLLQWLKGKAEELVVFVKLLSINCNFANFLAVQNYASMPALPLVINIYINFQATIACHSKLPIKRSFARYNFLFCVFLLLVSSRGANIISPVIRKANSNLQLNTINTSLSIKLPMTQTYLCIRQIFSVICS